MILFALGNTNYLWRGDATDAISVALIVTILSAIAWLFVRGAK